MIADIAHNHPDLADVLFLIAAILFVLDIAARRWAREAWVLPLQSAGLACLAVAWLVL